MPQKIGARLRHLLAAPSRHDSTHFHLSHDGRPYVCDFARCDSPGLTVDEVSGSVSLAPFGGGQL